MFFTYKEASMRKTMQSELSPGLYGIGCYYGLGAPDVSTTLSFGYSNLTHTWQHRPQVAPPFLCLHHPIILPSDFQIFLHSNLPLLVPIWRLPLCPYQSRHHPSQPFAEFPYNLQCQWIPREKRYVCLIFFLSKLLTFIQEINMYLRWTTKSAIKFDTTRVYRACHWPGHWGSWAESQVR